MRCQEFDLVVVDLVRPCPESDERSAALEHSRACARCSSLLEAEQRLTGELRGLAAETADATPPPSVEASVLAGFRDAQRTRLAPVARRPFPRPGIRLLAIAAGLVWVVGGTLAYRTMQAPVKTVLPVGEASEPVAPTIPTKSLPRTGTVASVSGSEVPVTNVRSTSTSRSRLHRELPVATHQADAPSPRHEVVTDYYSLVGAGDLRPRDGGQVVRVELPRSALATYGFQLNPESTGVPVTADVLLGNDGVARAIRFVKFTDSDGRSER